MAHVEALTGTDIEFGETLWQSLRSSETFPANGAFWLSKVESDPWHLMIATPRVDEVGPREAYAELAEITKHISGDMTRLLRVELISPQHPFYQALRSVFGQIVPAEGARLGGTQVSGMYIDDAYLYEIQ